MGNITTTAAALTGGVTAVTGVAKRYRVEYGGTWALDDLLQLELTATQTAKTDLPGYGTVTGLQPTFLFTFDDKLNFLAGSAWYFSGVAAPTVFNDANTLGTGFIELSNQLGSSEDLVAMATYQGGVAVMGRRYTQIWNVDPQAENYQKRQTLSNLGTVAKLSVQAVGDMDIYMLADNGVRSLRVRDASNNAIIADIGTPIDEPIQEVLRGLTDEQKAAACAVVEPSSNRYWLYLPTDYIYVFSYFPSSQIAAWSRYRPQYTTLTTVMPDVDPEPGGWDWTVTIGQTYKWTKNQFESSMRCGTVQLTESGYFVADATTVRTSLTGLGQGTIQLVTTTAFTPEKFVVQNGRVYARAGDKIFIFGGLNNQTYDRCLPQWDIPFLNAKSPATRKTYNGLDVICEGTWQVKLGTNVADAADLTTIYSNTGPSVMRGKSLAMKQGTHFKLRGIETSDGYARFSSAILHYEGGDAK